MHLRREVLTKLFDSRRQSKQTHMQSRKQFNTVSLQFQLRLKHVQVTVLCKTRNKSGNIKI